MEAIFGGSQATGKYATGSNKPLGAPTDLGQVDVETNEENTDSVKTDVQSRKARDAGADSSHGSDEKERGGKRRKLAQEEVDLMNGMIKAVQSVGDALKAPQHNEVHEDLYGCVMSCPEYSQEAPMLALVYLVKNKAEGLCFVQMTEAHRILWLRTYLSTTYFA
jgi:hypothetical protein